MMRFIFTIFVPVFLFSVPAFAGFEWIEPASVRDSAPAPQVMAPAGNYQNPMNTGGGFPAPPVLSTPLGVAPSYGAPVSILPSTQTSRAQRPKNLSGKKLVIDPYPLLNNALAPVQNASMTEVYKAINEESGKLHPVKLGSGMTTGAKRTMASVPTAMRGTAVKPNNILSPLGGGMTPMRGAEPAPLPGMAVPRAPIEAIAPAKKYTEAVGFGRDLPLALALSQVVPSGFTHSFAKNIDAGITVSWEGGKPWNQVLNDMLRPKNMTSVIQGNQVIIQPMGHL